MTRRPRIGVVGTGWWSTTWHIPSLLAYDSCQLVALADTDPARLAAASAHFGIEQTFNTAEDMFASGAVDGVVVAVPHLYHHPICRAALEHGIHVLVEKPLTLTSTHAWDLVHLAEQRELHLMVGFTHQFTATATYCRNAIQRGDIGDILLVSGLLASSVGSLYRGDTDAYTQACGPTLLGPHPDTYSNPQIAGGGQAQTQLSHTIGMALWATGGRVEQVFAHMNNRDLDVDLIDTLSCRLAGGALATMASTGAIQPSQPNHSEVRYYGTGGHIIQDLATATLRIHRNGKPGQLLSDADETYPGGQPARTFADLIAGHTNNPAPARAAAHTVECVEAAYRAHALGRPVWVDELDQPGPDTSAKG